MADYSEEITHALKLIDAGECDQAYLAVTEFGDFRNLAEQSYAEIGADDVAVAVHHEGEHTSAAQHVGVRVLYYAVVFHAPDTVAMPGSTIGVQTIINLELNNEQLSNLERAAVLGYPSILSTGDLAAMAELGYDLDSLRQEVIATNSSGDKIIPIPLSGTAELVGS